MEGRAHRTTGLKLAVETSILALLVGGWLWGIVALGAHATAAREPASYGGVPYERAVVSCPAPRETKEEGAAVGGEVCRPESRPHAGTSRQPGRSSEDQPSTHPGE